MIKAGLFLATFLSSFILVRSVPESGNKENERTVPTALRSALSVACTFLLSSTLRIVLSRLDIPHRTVTAFTILSVFLFAFFSELFTTPEYHDAFVPAAALILLMSIPSGMSFSALSLYCVGIGTGYVILMTVLSCFFERVFVSDAPKAVKGLPLLLCALSISAIAMSGF